MTHENPNLITQVPSQAELEANAAASANFDLTMNFRDPAQLEAFNADLINAGRAPFAAPGEYVSPVLTDKPSIAAEHEPFIEPESEQTITVEELRKLRAHAKNLGETALNKY